MNAIEMLKKDHRVIEELFQKYESLDGSDPAEKMTVFDEIRRALTLHARLEQEVFYPAYRQHYRPDGISPDEAVEQHKEVDRIFDRLQKIQAVSADFDAGMKELKRTVVHHVREEETEMFPSAEDKLGREKLEELAEKLQEGRRRLASEPSFRKSA
ncbi:MAG TPA: hemerythrin domain-containing protein [Planctomycetota bacterium]|nr:hemerythrin domain-containing protein [Planctomycetota bacterium]